LPYYDDVSAARNDDDPAARTQFFLFPQIFQANVIIKRR
jgi:hypothetical protein